MAFATLLIFATVPLLGGRLRRMTAVRLRYPWILVIALAVQFAISDVVQSWPRPLLDSLHLATYAAAAFVLWANRTIPGLVLIGVGAMTNAVVITLNRGMLPASARALRQAGWRVEDNDFANSGVLAHPVLPWLGDIVATPSWLPFRNVISVGDLLILLGVCVLAHAMTRSRAFALFRTAKLALRPEPARVPVG